MLAKQTKKKELTNTVLPHVLTIITTIIDYLSSQYSSNIIARQPVCHYVAPPLGRINTNAMRAYYS